jgi:hypothetical protein
MRAVADPALSRHVRDVFPELEHLFEAGENVRSLREHPGWDAVHELIKREIATVQIALDNASPLTRSEYASAHGRLRGLKALKGAADAIVEHAEKRHAEQRARHEDEDAAALAA